MSLRDTWYRITPEGEQRIKDILSKTVTLTPEFMPGELHALYTIQARAVISQSALLDFSYQTVLRHLLTNHYLAALTPTEVVIARLQGVL